MQVDGRATGRAARFGLYVHWPYCESKCPYCDFNSHVGGTVDAERWRRAYELEIARIAAVTGPRRLDTIFFGGGTPSLMPPEVVDAIIDAARRNWGFTNGIEISMEANPGSSDAARFADYKAAGVNRMSVGVQSFREADLKALGRRHTVREARSAIDLALGLFERVSFDLIYGRQNQRLADWVAELQEALAIGTSHLDLGAELYDATQEICDAAGLPAYEVSNHAAPGLECRHNLIYWTAGDWAGIGPGAHGRLSLQGRRIATRTPLQPVEWLERVERGCGEEPAVELSSDEQAREYLLSGLRLLRGIDLAALQALIGRPLDLTPLDDLTGWGMVHPLEDGTGRLRPTRRGLAVLDSVIRYLDAAWLT
jgi:oxygen-independent coproporphyrinogen-3 oxidase